MEVWGRVTWNGLVMFGWEQWIHWWEKMSWFMLRERKMMWKIKNNISRVYGVKHGEHMGHSSKPNTTMIYSLYSMESMESIWGEDCLDFKPEWWVLERGDIVHVPSFKFITFNARPRTCIGKDIASFKWK